MSQDPNLCGGADVVHDEAADDPDLRDGLLDRPSACQVLPQRKAVVGEAGANGLEVLDQSAQENGSEDSRDSSQGVQAMRHNYVTYYILAGPEPTEMGKRLVEGELWQLERH